MKHAFLTLQLLLLLVMTAAADTFVVDNTVDPGDGTCDSPGCTLHEAIDAANANPGADTIEFNISGAGVHTTALTMPLPTITEAVTIDGYTQPGASENSLAVGDNAVLLIQIDGTSAGLFVIGLNMSADGCLIRGLVINRFDAGGININGDDNVIEGNFVGIDTRGEISLRTASRG